MWQIESQIRYIQAQIAGNSGTITKICNADVADLGFKVRIHELIEVPLNIDGKQKATLINLVRDRWRPESGEHCETLTKISARMR